MVAPLATMYKLAINVVLDHLFFALKLKRAQIGLVL